MKVISILAHVVAITFFVVTTIGFFGKVALEGWSEYFKYLTNLTWTLHWLFFTIESLGYLELYLWKTVGLLRWNAKWLFFFAWAIGSIVFVLVFVLLKENPNILIDAAKDGYDMGTIFDMERLYHVVPFVIYLIYLPLRWQFLIHVYSYVWYPLHTIENVKIQKGDPVGDMRTIPNTFIFYFVAPFLYLGFYEFILQFRTDGCNSFQEVYGIDVSYPEMTIITALTIFFFVILTLTVLVLCVRFVLILQQEWALAQREDSNLPKKMPLLAMMLDPELDKRIHPYKGRVNINNTATYLPPPGANLAASMSRAFGRKIDNSNSIWKHVGEDSEDDDDDDEEEGNNGNTAATQSRVTNRSQSQRTNNTTGLEQVLNQDPRIKLNPYTSAVFKKL